MGDRFLVTRARGTAGKGKVFWLAPREGGEDYSANFIREVPPQGPPQGPPPYTFIYHF